MNLYARLAGWEVLGVTGSDAKDFLQRLTSADFRRLTPGEFTPGTLLAATGKIIAYFKAIASGPGAYLLLAPDAAAAQRELERMHFRENLTLDLQTSKWAYLRVVGTNPAALDRLTGAADALAEVSRSPRGTASIRYQRGDDGGGIALVALCEQKWATPPLRFDIGALTPASRVAELIGALNAAGFEAAADLEAYRLRAMDPAAPNELGPSTIPLEAGLDDAVHENKGCFPGQEVVERIRAMGQVPRLLAQLRGEGDPPAPPLPVEIDRPEGGAVEAGTVTSAHSDPFDGGWVGLGFLRRTFARPDGSYRVAGQPVKVRFK